MAMTEPTRTRLWSRLHLLLRVAGLTGLFVAGVGLVLRAVGNEDLGRSLALGGEAAALLALLVEVLGVIRLASGRRSAFGTNVVLQVALAAVILVGINAFSFFHYVRFDTTREQLFTIPAEIRAQLSRLRGETTIVVHQRHVTFGQLSDKPDNYDSAAERKVVEKVQDLVEQFQELGPRFKVEVLDVQEEAYQDKLAALTEGAPELRESIERTPESSVFFYAGGKVQRLGFQDIYQLDKQASQEANDGRGNLVLRYQGVEPFARKVLTLDEKQPRVAVGVVHEILGLDGSEELGMAGVKKTLAARGIDGRDVLLKKWSEFAPPEPAVFTYDENKLERLEEQITELEANVKNLDEELKELTGLVKQWETAPLDELTKKFAREIGVRQVTEPIRREFLKLVLEPNVALRQLLKDQDAKELEGLQKDKDGLRKAEENLAETRRIADLKAKADRLLADCDLLILPRMTLFNVARGERIGNWVYRLDQAQVDAVKDFLKAGKPVLVCFGPVNEPAGARMDPMEAGPDRFEELLGSLGIKLARQTVLFNVESKSFAERRSGLVVLGANVEVPPVKFDWETGAGQPSAKAVTAEPGQPNPIRESLRLTARSLGKDQPLDLRVRHPRPVYYEPRGDSKPAVEAEFMLTDERSWNEDQPFPTRERTPRYEPPKGDDPSKDPLEKERLGPFPIGVAAEVTLPADWYEDKEARPATVRVAAIGHGGLFMGNTLSPIKEKLFLDVCNWLLGRDDLLAKQGVVWEYPRVALAASDNALWQWGTRLGMPVLFVYLGFVVLLVRRLR
jgi:hypothetical protein